MKKLSNLVATVGDNLQSLVLLIIRLYWGWQFFQTGKGKLMNLDRTGNYFATLNIPLPHLQAALAGTVECLGGLLLLVGLGARLVSVPLIFVMGVAYYTAENAELHAIFSDPDKFTGAAPFLFLAAALLVLVFGPGKVSIDAMMGKGSASK
jgi:putative oxidoreductase